MKLLLILILFPSIIISQIVIGDTASSGIIYKNIKDSTIAMVLKSTNYADFDFDGDLSMDIRFQVYQNYSPGFTALNYSAISLSSNLDLIAVSTDTLCADTAAVNTIVDANSPWFANSGSMYLHDMFYTMGTTTYRGVFKIGENYLAFRKITPSDTVYGWFLLNRATSLTVRSWAYRTKCSSLAPLSVVSSSSLICANESATITASGAASYTWSLGQSSASIIITPSVTTTYSVSGTILNDCILNSTITQSVEACVGIREYSTEKMLLYPNPAKNQIYISIPELRFSKGEIVITNLLGDVIHRTSYAEEFDISYLPEGCYILLVKLEEGKSFHSKFLKVKN